MVRDLDISTVAEGTETKAEAEACRAIGFDLAQGYYFGRPAPLDAFAASLLGARAPR
jgi:EAL domain-containing protein (putative c-di-GMP-specific phosphodiesterase class I)